jgi:hypothetical protein
MLQFLRRLTAPFRSRRMGMSSEHRPRHAVLAVEAFEDRLAPASITSFGGWDIRDASASQESQISYWSWGERQIPVEQFVVGSTR